KYHWAKLNPNQPTKHLILYRRGEAKEKRWRDKCVMAKDHFVRSFWTEKFQRRFLSCAGDFTRVSLCLVLFGYPPSLLAQVQQGSDQQSPGTIVGTVEDQSGAVSVGARVRLNHDGQSDTQEVLSGNNGQFSFTRVPPGPFHLTITWQG